MKVAVSGKGGSGKTSVCANLARVFASRGFGVLAVDADASLNLSSMLWGGTVKPLSGVREVVDGRARMPDGLVRMNPDVRDLVDEYSVDVSKNLRLLTLGTVKKAGAGCLCPENALLRALLRELVTKRDEVVLIDLEAGLEPMSRGTVKNLDIVLVVTEPSINSADVSERIISLCSDLSVARTLVVANKVRDDGDSKFLSERFDVFSETQEICQKRQISACKKRRGPPLFHIPFDDEYRVKSMRNEAADNGLFFRAISTLAEKLNSEALDD